MTGVNCVLEAINNIAKTEKGSVMDRLLLPMYALVPAAGVAWEAGKNGAAGAIFEGNFVGSMYQAASTVGMYAAGAVAGVAILSMTYSLGKGPFIEAARKLNDWLDIDEKIQKAQSNTLSSPQM